MACAFRIEGAKAGSNDLQPSLGEKCLRESATAVPDHRAALIEDLAAPCRPHKRTRGPARIPSGQRNSRALRGIRRHLWGFGYGAWHPL